VHNLLYPITCSRNPRIIIFQDEGSTSKHREVPIFSYMEGTSLPSKACTDEYKKYKN
jgi:hypothetical protein